MHCPNNALHQLLEQIIIDYSCMRITARDVTRPQSFQQLSNTRFLLKRKQIGDPILYMDEPNSEEGTAPAPWCRKLEVIVVRNRNELEGNEGDHDR